jgi:hypothetical protein
MLILSFGRCAGFVSCSGLPVPTPTIKIKNKMAWVWHVSQHNHSM